MLSVPDSPVRGPVAGTPHSGMSIVGYQSGSRIVGITAESPNGVSCIAATSCRYGLELLNQW